MGFDLVGNSGNFFHSTNWSWDPIVWLLDVSGQFSEKTILRISGNDGHKFSKASALKMARVVNDFLEVYPVEETPAFYRNLGRDKERVNAEGLIIKEGNKGYEQARSAWIFDREFAIEFLKFLRDSNGFEVD